MLDILFSLFTLTLLEIILGIDNLVFLAILSSKLPQSQQKLARRLGLCLALVTRLILLAFAIKIVGLTKPLFSIFSFSFSGRDLFFLLGGLFLLIKGTQEIHHEIEGKTEEEEHKKASSATQSDCNLSQKNLSNSNGSRSSSYENRPKPKGYQFFSIILQIGIFDIIFSLDSILTAVGLTQKFWIMTLAILIAIIMMIFVSEPLSQFINKYPTIKMLALSFLLLIGTALIADAFHFDIPRGYIYFSVCFSLFVESLNILLSHKQRVKLR